MDYIDDRGKVKIIAFYLPQFHECDENNEWWGEGFTEWTNTRKAVKIYAGHNQPREPLNDYYYDLSNLKDIVFQIEMAKKYGIYGFCYYHYWFQGKLLLNKPLELLRDSNVERLPYCFCWANESWTRTWEGSKEVLLKQEYGGVDDWEAHFQYLLSFFHDDKYIKKNGAPMMVLYRTKNIPDCDNMISYWDKRCKDEGFKGIFVVEELNCFQNNVMCERSKAFLEFEPLYTMTFGSSLLDNIYFSIMSKIFNWKNNSSNQIYSYDRLWKNILRRKHKKERKKICFLGAFVDWDNTARKGKFGRIVLGVTPQKFEKYMSRQYKKAFNLQSEYIFINAWNEWGEGTYLEPDKKVEYGYLEIVKKICAK